MSSWTCASAPHLGLGVSPGWLCVGAKLRVDYSRAFCGACYFLYLQCLQRSQWEWLSALSSVLTLLVNWDSCTGLSHLLRYVAIIYLECESLLRYLENFLGREGDKMLAEPEMLWNLCPWRCSRLSWMRPWVVWSNYLAFIWRLGKVTSESAFLSYSRSVVFLAFIPLSSTRVKSSSPFWGFVYGWL